MPMKYQPDDILVILSPFSGEFEASYRGPGEPGKAVVWTGRTQIQVPEGWILGKKGEGSR